MDNKILLQDIVDYIANKQGVTRKAAETFAKSFFEAIEDSLLSERLVRIKGFGTFKLINVGERESINVNTGERFQIEGHSKVSFTPETDLKNRINKPFAHFETVVINEGTDLEKLENVETIEPPTEDSPIVENDKAEQDKEGQTENKSSETGLSGNEETSNETTSKEENLSPSNESESITQEEENITSSETTIQQEESQASQEAINKSPIETPDSTKAESEGVCANEPTAGSPIEVAEEEKEKLEGKKEKEVPIVSIPQPFEVTVTGMPTTEPKRVSLWKIFITVLSVLLLMAAGYILGYFQSFGGSREPATATKNISRPIERQTIVHPVDTNKGKDSIVKDSTQQSISTVDDKASSYKQLPNGKYLIIGTMKRHKIVDGENLQTIAETYYGSRGYVPYIILYNKIKNPDDIKYGRTLKLPKLERANKKE